MGYRTFPPITTYGFVVKVHTPLNLDIDITLPKDQAEKYLKASMYKLYKFDDEKGDVYSSRAFRCRLKGLSPKKEMNNYDTRMVIDYIQKKLGEQRNWVGMTVGDVDSYKRILVTIYDPITKVNINDMIINKFPHIYTTYEKQYTQYKPRYTYPQFKRYDQPIKWRVRESNMCAIGN